jgi:hypothetical protein
MHLSVDNTLCLVLYAILDSSDCVAIFILIFIAAYSWEYARDSLYNAFHQIMFYGTRGYVNLRSHDRKFHALWLKAMAYLAALLKRLFK